MAPRVCHRLRSTRLSLDARMANAAIFDMRALGHEAVGTIVALAADEAAEAGCSQISAAHLLIALSRFSERQGAPDAAAAKPLSQEFEQLGIEARKFRRRLRALLGRRDDPAAVKALHRSRGLESVMAAAERAAMAANEALTPVWLLRAAFASLGDEAFCVSHNRGDDIPSEL